MLSGAPALTKRRPQLTLTGARFFTQVIGGRLDYAEIRGDTGALVYPAGHVWLFSFFHAAAQWNETLHTTE